MTREHLKSWPLWGIVAIAAILITVLVKWGFDDDSRLIDPPPFNLAAVTMQDAALSSQSSMAATVYTMDRYGYVVPLQLNMPETDSIAKQTLQYMVRQGPATDQLPEGFTALMPEHTEVLGLSVIAGTAVVDFSSEFLNYDASLERKLLEGIVWSLTQYESIDQVQLKVDGKQLAQMPQKGTPLAGSLSTAIGINVEKTPGLNWSQSIPVTLYFQSESAEQVPYYVPVTRMIPKSDDVASSVMEHLIKGPSIDSSLLNMLDTAVHSYQVSQSDQAVIINFTGDEAALPNEETLQTITMSMMENTGLSAVQILINGVLMGEDDTSDADAGEADEAENVNFEADPFVQSM